MNPTKAEVDEAIRQYVSDKTFYRDLAAHNAAQSKKHARESVSLHRARKLDEMQSANHAQLQTAIRGSERYDFHESTFPYWRSILLLALLAAVGILIIRSL